MKRSGVLCTIAALLFVLLAVPAAQAGVVMGSWFDKSDSAHQVVAGEPAALRAITTLTTTGLKYKWTYGDGLVDAAYTAITDRYAIEATHYYCASGSARNADGSCVTPAPAGSNYTATLRVYSSKNALQGSDTFKIAIVADSDAVRKAQAVDDGLWWLHKRLSRYTTTAANGNAPAAKAVRLDNGGDYDPDTVLVGQTFVDAGVKATDTTDNPYVEDLKRIINFTTERLGIMKIDTKDGDAVVGNTSAEGPYPAGKTNLLADKLGVFFKEYSWRGSEVEYGLGPALKLLITSGYTTQKPVAYDTRLNFSGTTKKISGWTYQQIMQQMIDWIAWAQLYGKANDYSWCVNYDLSGSCIDAAESKIAKAPFKKNVALAPNSRGGWPYFAEGWHWDNTLDGCASGGRGNMGDVSISYWTVSALIAADAKPALNLVYPTYVKTELETFLSNNQDPKSGGFYFGAAACEPNINLVERTGEGLAMLSWLGVPSTDARVSSALGFIAANWNQHTYEHRQGHPDPDHVCYAEGGTTLVPCAAHFDVGVNTEGFWICRYNDNTGCGYQAISTPDDMNIFAFRTLTEGVKAYEDVSGWPTTDPLAKRYQEILVKNQYQTGAWDDTGWVSGYELGTNWAVQTLLMLP